MPSTPADAKPSFGDSEAALTTAEGASIVPAQVRERSTSFHHTSDFSASRVLRPPLQSVVFFVRFVTRHLEGRKMSGGMLEKYTDRVANARSALIHGFAQRK
jgi:hypothetical protein